MRRALPVLLAALATVASAQPDSTASAVADSVALRTPSEMPPTPRRVTTVPLPNGPGVFYYRAGTPGGVRLRSQRSRPTPPETSTVSPTQTPLAPLAVERRDQAALAEGLSRLDLLLLEQRLLQAIDQRLAGLDLGGRRSQITVPPSGQAPVIVLPPSQATPGAPIAEPSPTPEVSPSPVVPVPVQPLPLPLVEEIERAILDTGLFRTTRVNFEFGEADLIPVSEETLRAIAAVLRRYPALQIEVGGHTDAISSDAFNLRLSQRRAESVRDFLIGSGVEARRITAVGYGEARPVASNDTETGRALNRRVEFVVLNPEAAEQERRTTREETPEPADDLRQLIRDEFERLRREDG